MDCGEQVGNRAVDLEDITGEKEMEGFCDHLKQKHSGMSINNECVYDFQQVRQTNVYNQAIQTKLRQNVYNKPNK